MPSIGVAGLPSVVPVQPVDISPIMNALGSRQEEKRKEEKMKMQREEHGQIMESRGNALRKQDEYDKTEAQFKKDMTEKYFAAPISDRPTVYEKLRPEYTATPFLKDLEFAHKTDQMRSSITPEQSEAAYQLYVTSAPNLNLAVQDGNFQATKEILDKAWSPILGGLKPIFGMNSDIPALQITAIRSMFDKAQTKQEQVDALTALRGMMEPGRIMHDILVQQQKRTQEEELGTFGAKEEIRGAAKKKFATAKDSGGMTQSQAQSALRRIRTDRVKLQRAQESGATMLPNGMDTKTISLFPQESKLTEADFKRAINELAREEARIVQEFNFDEGVVAGEAAAEVAAQPRLRYDPKSGKISPIE